MYDASMSAYLRELSDFVIGPEMAFCKADIWFNICPYIKKGVSAMGQLTQQQQQERRLFLRDTKTI